LKIHYFSRIVSSENSVLKLLEEVSRQKRHLPIQASSNHDTPLPIARVVILSEQGARSEHPKP
ncbi:MAG: hypothetical protein U9N87_07235, partial [Planctomycetota bacterium]|nr:hypothetical protein [Planctomycetota bacterium]